MKPRGVLQAARLTLTAVFALTIGCSGGSEPSGGLGPAPTPTGSLAVTVNGLPAGSPAQVQISGPNGYSRTVTVTETITGLVAGSYTLAASNVVVNGDGYQAAPATQILSVAASATANAHVDYAIGTGRLALSVDGIAEGGADLLVTGPGGVSHTATGSDTLRALAPGNYTVRIRPVTVDGDQYGMEPDSILVLVTAGTTPSPVAVHYALETGRVNLDITQVPSGAVPNVFLSGPGGFSMAVTSPQLLKGLPPGRYTVQGADLTVSGDRYEAVAVPNAVDVTASSTAASVAVSYRIATGSLALSIAGLPSGVDADVTVTGPGGFATRLAAGTTLKGLTPGTYTITGASVAAGGSTYVPQPATQTVAIAADAQPAARQVTYGIGVGSLTITVAGLPGGASGAVTVAGPSGYSTSVTATTTLSSLAPGSYTITAAAVSAGGQTYQPTPTTQSRTVVIGSTVAATVTYAVSTGSLMVTTTGLPGGVSAAVTVTGPGGFNQSLTGTATLTGLAPGSYTVSANSVSSGGQTYQPTPTTQAATVSAGNTASATVSYAGSTGALAVTVTGLPNGTLAAVTVTGPGGYNQTVTATATLTGLSPGSYTVAATAVSAGGQTYTPTPLSQSATVTAGATATAPVAYATSTLGNLTIDISGLPPGTSANVTVTGPGGYNQAVTATQTLTGLTPGNYSVFAANTYVGSTNYLAQQPSQGATVTAGTTVSKSVVYVATGSLKVAVAGLPGGTNASITVTGPGSYTQTTTGTVTYTSLTAGTYTVTANSVISGGTPYLPTPTSQSPVVTGGATTTATVTYAAGSSSTLNLNIDGMYLTQATARYDGTTPVITGRDAYLRVFVKANQANTATPSVRVRFYSGGTLLQTSTIPAPGASVPTTITEGVLNSSWNLAVPGSMVQPNLKILADVDPSNAVAESDETDNNFPASGTPFSIDVRTVPTWQVRFVPVLQQANGLQGNITSSNMAQFLTDPLKLLPVASYNADIRAPYTTTAGALQSGDGNGAWETIVLEILTLRNVDASTRYYYGVVKTNYSSGVAGIGYVGGGFLAALGWDYLPSGSGVMAHETGHNMGRNHSPCGGASSPDPNYPYPGASIGTYGLDLTTLTVKTPSANYDFMAYCNPAWVSDYTWSGLIANRTSNPNYAPPLASTATAGLLVWARITPHGVVMEPSFRVAPPTTRPTGSGAYRVEGYDAGGRLLFSYPVEPQHTMAINMNHEMHISTVLPLDAAQDQALARVRLITPDGPVERVSNQAVAQIGNRIFLRDPAAQLAVPNTAQARFTWDGSVYPMAMVRDAATGQVLSFARGGNAVIWTGSRRFDVTFSDGVRSLVKRIQ